MAARALDLFRMGWDTFDIAKGTKRTEAEVFEEMSIQRSAEMGRPDPYAHLLTEKPCLNPYRNSPRRKSIYPIRSA